MWGDLEMQNEVWIDERRDKKDRSERSSYERHKAVMDELTLSLFNS